LWRGKFSVLDGIKYARNSSLNVYLSDEYKKPKAVLNIKNFTITTYHTFCDIYTKHSLNIVPVIAIDFSLSNVDIESNNYNYHALVDGE
jgi:hypothetical protein